MVSCRRRQRTLSWSVSTSNSTGAGSAAARAQATTARSSRRSSKRLPPGRRVDRADHDLRLRGCRRARLVHFQSELAGQRDDRPGDHARQHRRQRLRGGQPRLFVRDAVVDAEGRLRRACRCCSADTAGQASASTVTVDFGTSGGTATAGATTTAVSGTLTFAPGQTGQDRRRRRSPTSPPEADPTSLRQLTNVEPTAGASRTARGRR